MLILSKIEQCYALLNFWSNIPFHKENISCFPLIIASRCLLCKEALETNKHLFMHCEVTTQIWAMFTAIAGINWIMPEHTADLLSCWIRRGGSKSQKYGGGQSQPASGGPFGRRGTRGSLREKNPLF